VEEPSREQIEESIKILKTNSEKVIMNILAALLIWLFGNLVFVPLAASLNLETKLLTSIIFFIAFTIPIIHALPGLKKSIDAFSILPFKKLVRKGFTVEESRDILRNLMYVISGVIFYFLFSSFLVIFHPSVSGIALILLIIWIFVVFLKVGTIVFPKFINCLLR